MGKNKKIKVIAVDDNKHFLKGLSMLLSKNEKYELVNNYTSPLSFLIENKYYMADVILLDVEMPEMNGIELAQRINHLRPHIKLIAITMYQDKVYLGELIGCGFKGIVFKPHISDFLYNVIDEVVEGKFCFPEEQINITGL